MKIKSTIIVLVGILVGGPALAGEAHVCKSQPVSSSSANPALTDATVFRCGGNVSGTIPELARQGWKIVQQTDQADMINPELIYAQLIIQKD